MKSGSGRVRVVCVGLGPGSGFMVQRLDRVGSGSGSKFAINRNFLNLGYKIEMKWEITYGNKCLHGDCSHVVKNYYIRPTCPLFQDSKQQRVRVIFRAILGKPA